MSVREERNLAQALKAALKAGSPPGPGSAGTGSVVVLGVGSELRSDDAAGLLVVSGLAELSLPGLHAIPGGTAPENRTAEIRRIAPSAVVIVDAAQMGEPPGAVRIIPLADVGGVSFSTHTLPLHIVANYLGREIGCAVALIGIQPVSLAFDGPVSPEVTRAARRTVEALREALETGER